LHEKLKRLVDHLKEAVANSWDGVILVDGLEGSGKSGLSLEIAYELDKNFCLDRVVFDSEQFFKAIDESQIGQAIVWDEFITGGMSSDALTKVQKSVTRKMVMIRKKRLFIILVLPYFFLTGRYFAVARSRFLLHTYTPDGIKRGYWQAWNYDRKRRMYFRGKQEFDYCISPFSSGTFEDFFKKGVIDKDAYEAKKDAAILELEFGVNGKDDKPPNPNLKVTKALKKLISFVMERSSPQITVERLGVLLGLKPGYIKENLIENTNNGDSNGL
jgi:hypothetical protein